MSIMVSVRQTKNGMALVKGSDFDVSTKEGCIQAVTALVMAGKPLDQWNIWFTERASGEEKPKPIPNAEAKSLLKAALENGWEFRAQTFKTQTEMGWMPTGDFKKMIVGPKWEPRKKRATQAPAKGKAKAKNAKAAPSADDMQAFLSNLLGK